MINRAVVVIKYKAKFLNWILRSKFREVVDTDGEFGYAYLISHEESQDMEAWAKFNWEEIFESELRDWSEDESIWPQNRDYDLFRIWLKLECHTVVRDRVFGPIIDDEKDLLR